MSNTVVRHAAESVVPNIPSLIASLISPVMVLIEYISSACSRLEGLCLLHPRGTLVQSAADGESVPLEGLNRSK